MKLTMKDLKKKYTDLISEEISFEEASEWATSMIEMDESGQLEIQHGDDVSKIFDCLTYLCGINMQKAPKEYLYTIDDVKDKFTNLFDVSER